jgi:hypothetical protein
MTVLAAARVGACLSEGKGAGGRSRARTLSWLGGSASVQEAAADYLM